MRTWKSLGACLCIYFRCSYTFIEPTPTRFCVNKYIYKNAEHTSLIQKDREPREQPPTHYYHQNNLKAIGIQQSICVFDFWYIFYSFFFIMWPRLTTYVTSVNCGCCVLMYRICICFPCIQIGCENWGHRIASPPYYYLTDLWAIKCIWLSAFGLWDGSWLEEELEWFRRNRDIDVLGLIKHRDSATVSSAGQLL